MIFVIVCYDVETHGVRLRGVRLREGYCAAGMVVFFVCRDVACNVSTVFAGHKSNTPKNEILKTAIIDDANNPANLENLNKITKITLKSQFRQRPPPAINH
ncbi:MAG: hypothetical protein LBD59_01735 [Prevotellaceae bacterium]|jgi:hypothetical protein|nr:hypothetical protein [Prevotellaceae bacterium]